MNFSVFPKVFDSYKKQTLTIRLIDAEAMEILVSIQPMEKYGIAHTKYRIDENTRYPFYKLTKNGDGAFTIDYDFSGEQKYYVRVQLGENVAHSFVYAVEKDFRKLRPFKGDTHLHSNRSDGDYSPFELACLYRKNAYDFIAITDHHKMYPSIEGKKKIETLTNKFTVFRGEEVHNKDMGYFHIVNFDGNESVNDWIEEDHERAHKATLEIMASLDKSNMPNDLDAYSVAFRTLVERKIHEGGGLAIMAHPFWTDYGEYNIPTDEIKYIWRYGSYDALELLGSTDSINNGDNLQLALWEEMRVDGLKIPVVGASDFHTLKRHTQFNKHFTLGLGESPSDIKNAITSERTVAVERQSDERFFVFGRFRVVKYARFLLEEFYPEYLELAKIHAEALECESRDDLRKAEAEIEAFEKRFFGTK